MNHSRESQNKVLTTAVGNAELYADTTTPKKLQELAKKNMEEKKET